MRTNRILAKMKASKLAYGLVQRFPSEVLVELTGRAGFDFIMFDGEHGPFTRENIETMCRCTDMAGITPIARVPDIEMATILGYLDRGIMGIMGPHITTLDEARQLAEACRYKPHGKRSLGTTRGGYYGDVDSITKYMEHMNSEVLVIAQIENVQALENITAIVAVEGIDLFATGPQDMAQSLGLPGQPNHPKVVEANARVADAVHAGGKKMLNDVTVSQMTDALFLGAAKAYLKSELQKTK